MSAYKKITETAVRSFLQNVVIVDNEATYEPSSNEPVGEIVEPGPRGQVEQDSQSDVKVSNVLNAKMITESFASAGLVCSILRPNSEDDLTDQIQKAADKSDIFVADWDLVAADNGAKARGIIKSIVEMDNRHKSRLRLIAIYTAETNTSNIRDLIYDDLSRVVENLIKQDEAFGGGIRFVAKNENTRFVVIRKGASDDGPTGEQVGERHLADRLIEEFTLLAHGILPTVGLACISAIRDKTYHLLSRFHSGLDASYLLHRFMLAQPDESEKYAADLIGSEIHALIEANVKLTDYVGPLAINDVLSDMVTAGHSFTLKVGNCKELTLDQAKEMALKGKSTVQSLGSVSNEAFKKFEKKPQDFLNELLHNDKTSSELSNLEFARISAFKRESWGSGLTPANWLPQLSRGTVVRRNKDDTDWYWVCIQPLCDCVRIKSKSPFIFAKLKEVNGESFDLVVRDSNKKDIKLVLDSAPSKLRHFKFEGTEETGYAVVALHQDGKHYFKSDEYRLEWLGDLRSAIASRLVHQVTTQLSRVGLDEFEWQRLHAQSTSS